MARSNADLLALKAELTNDPEGLGLTTAPEDDAANANKLNLVRTTIQVKKRSLATAALFNACPALEQQDLTEQQDRYLKSVLSLQQIDPFASANIMDGLTGDVNGMFGPGTQSKANISALTRQDGNRIEQLFQDGALDVGGTVTPSDISQARAAT